MAGLFQVIINGFVAIISYFVIIYDETVLDIILDFLALTVIAELSEYFFQEYVTSNEICKTIINDKENEGSEKWDGLFTIETTTSTEARSGNIL